MQAVFIFPVLKKSKSVFLHTMKAFESVEIYFQSFLTLAVDEGELSHLCCGHFTPREVIPSTYCKRG
jgi:hypothetical protein